MQESRSVILRISALLVALSLGLLSRVERVFAGDEKPKLPNAPVARTAGLIAPGSITPVATPNRKPDNSGNVSSEPRQLRGDAEEEALPDDAENGAD